MLCHYNTDLISPYLIYLPFDKTQGIAEAMKLSRKTYYGLRACLALAQTKDILSIQALSEQESIPFGYLEKILQSLRKAGVVEAKKGTSGGYTLATKPEDISVWTILFALEGPLKTFPAAERSLSQISLANLLAGKTIS